ncbi:putative secreted protein with basic tail [Ixodes scapularis]
MGLTGTALVLVCVAFFGSAAAHNCKNGTRPASEENREGCDYYCWNDVTSSWDQFFFGNGERCFVAQRVGRYRDYAGRSWQQDGGARPLVPVSYRPRPASGFRLAHRPVQP